MCTVVFLAREDGGYVLAGNRDELDSRAPALPPRRHVVDGLEVAHPTDPDGGGTWIATNAAGLTLTLLNAYQDIARWRPVLPLVSRGTVVASLMASRRVDEVVAALQRDDADALAWPRIAPFLLIAAEPGSTSEPARAAKLHWSGDALTVTPWAAPKMLVASSLEPLHVRPVRERALEPLLSTPIGSTSADSVHQAFADHTPQRGAASLCMHGPIGGTVSHTYVEVDRGRVRMRYHGAPPCQPTQAAELVLQRADQ